MKLVNNGKAQVCRACLNVKPVSQFYKNSSTETGYCRYCKTCGYPTHNHANKREGENIKNHSLADMY